jgi:PBP1b-binding outer membrane lipoprotein LpoB
MRQGESGEKAMKPVCALIFAALLLGGCMTMPEAPTVPPPPPRQAAEAPPIEADQVTEANAHAVARALKKEMDRAEAGIKDEG